MRVFGDQLAKAGCRSGVLASFDCGFASRVQLSVVADKRILKNTPWPLVGETIDARIEKSWLVAKRVVA